MKSLSVEERKLLIIMGFDILAYSLASVFVTVFFFAHSDISTTALFRVVAFASMTFFYTLSGFMLRYMSSGTLIKLGLYGGALFYLLLFILREASITWYVPLAILDGFTAGVFWSGFNLNQYILSSAGRRVSYFGWGQVLFNLGAAIGPALGGLIIAVAGATIIGVTGGYITLFLLVGLIMFFVAVLVGRLPGYEMPEFRYQHVLKHKRTRSWKLVLGQQGALGFYDVCFGTVSSILLFLIIQSERQLGIMYTIAAVLATMSSLVVTRFMVKHPSTYWVGIIGSALGIAVFAWNQTIFGAWLMIGISGLSVPFMLTKLSAEYYDALDEAPGTWQQKYHMIIERDGVLGLFRTASYLVLFIFLQFGDEIRLARVFLFVLPIFPLTIGILLHLGSRTKKTVCI